MVTESSPAPAGRDNHVQSVERAGELLKAVAASTADEASVPALAAAVGLHRATAYRILLTLESLEFVVRDGAGGFRIGPAIVELARSVGHEQLLARVHPSLVRLAAQVGETASFAIPSGGHLVYVDEVMPAKVLAASWIGRAVPWHATSTGKAFLAALGERERDILLGPGALTRYTETTLTSRDALLAELAATRERGFGTCRGELESTLDGVSSAILDGRGRPAGVLSLWWPVGRLDEARAARAAELCQAEAAHLSRG